MKVYTERDRWSPKLKDLRIVVLGYGNQGRPQALNLRDSGFDVTVAARVGGKAWARAEEDGFRPLEPEAGISRAEVLLFLLPDEVQGEVFHRIVAGNLKPGAALCFAHGFAVAFKMIATAVHDLILVAPKGQGNSLRERYLRGSGLPCLLAVENDVSGKGKDIALALAGGLGCLRVGAFETSFREEAVSDLFGEQAILCGGVPALVKTAFKVLVGRGFSPEVAYFECCHELKIIVDLFTSRGFAGMREMISRTAAYGGLKEGEPLVSEEVEQAMEALFNRIDSGEFASGWMADAGGGHTLEKLQKVEKELLIEKTGKRIRRLFPVVPAADRGEN